jgi:four helix bundle protein
MATIKKFEDLEIWKIARKLCLDIEKNMVKDLDQRNKRLKDQIQGSSGSIMDNIAEGFEKESTKEFIQYLFYSKASCGETRSQLIRIKDFEYFNDKLVNELIKDSETITSKIKSLISYLKNVQHKGNRYASEPEINYGFDNIELPDQDFDPGMN